jgi:hypothetical protein
VDEHRERDLLCYKTRTISAVPSQQRTKITKTTNGENEVLFHFVELCMLLSLEQTMNVFMRREFKFITWP